MIRLLEIGDVIDIIAPSSKATVSGEHELACDRLRELGYIPRMMPDIMTGIGLPYHANSDEYRVNDFVRAAFAEDSDFIWCLRGGYGAAKIVEAIDRMGIKPEPKTIIGFSDITALHLYASQNWGWQCVHGAVFTHLIKQGYEQSAQQVVEFLSMERVDLNLFDIVSINGGTINDYSKLTGGNLAIVQTSIGTCWQMQAKGKVVILEDTSERGYKVDRMLNHLSQAKILDGCSGVIFGNFDGSDEEDGSNYVELAIKNWAMQQTFPVMKTGMIGHRAEGNQPWRYTGNS